MLAVATLRGAWRTTLVFAVLAGVAGGLVLGGWAAVRRAATSIDRFEQSVGGADLTVATCGPDGHFDLDAGQCDTPYLPVAERDRIAALPGVDAAGIGAILPLWYSSPKLPDGQGGGVWAMADDTFPTALGDPVVVAGRMFDPDAPDEVLLTEDIVAASGIGVGDVLTVRGYPLAQGIDLEADPQGEPIPVRVVGVVRFPTDLSPQRSNWRSSQQVDANPFLTRAWYERYGQHLAAFSTAVFVRFSPGADPTAAIGEALAGQQTLLTPTAAESDVGTVRDAVRYETGVVAAVTVAAALAAIVVVGLSIARQAAQDHDDPLVLAAIGTTRRQRAACVSDPVDPRRGRCRSSSPRRRPSPCRHGRRSAWRGGPRSILACASTRSHSSQDSRSLPRSSSWRSSCPRSAARRAARRAWGSSVGTAAAMAGCSPEVTTGLVLAFPGGRARRASAAPVIAGAMAAGGGRLGGDAGRRPRPHARRPGALRRQLGRRHRLARQHRAGAGVQRRAARRRATERCRRPAVHRGVDRRPGDARPCPRRHRRRGDHPGRRRWSRADPPW